MINLNFARKLASLTGSPQLPWARAVGRPGVWRVLEMTLLVLLEAGSSLWASYHCVPVTAQLHFLQEAGQLVSWSAGHLGLRESRGPFLRNAYLWTPREATLLRLACYPTLGDKGDARQVAEAWK